MDSKHSPAKQQRIPVKTVKIHKPAESEADRFSPRHQIYVRKMEGVFQRLRQRMNFVFLFLFAGLPWLQFNGQQAILFDLAEQRFNIFSLTLWPQDLTLLAWIFIIGAFALFFVTTFLGRVWCGYMCPQTVWTFIFIWFEEKFEGNANQRKKLDRGPLDLNKLWRKTAKHFCWFAFSLLTALTFIGYFVPMQELMVDFFTFNSSFLVVSWVLFFAFCTYGNAGWMREIMCLHMCPYSRFQSAMFDKDTLTVSYDTKRGENRGARKRKDDPKALGLGDCIDCNLCVQVCPTGIDIRNGLQYECINCGACVDACDATMERMKYPKGLIRYTTEHELAGKKVHILRGKLIGYALVLLVMCSAFVIDLSMRQPVALDIIRDRNTLARENSQGLVENVYTLKILNKSQLNSVYRLSVEGLKDYQWQGQNEVTVGAAQVMTLPISIAVDPYDLTSLMTEIEFVIELVDPADDSVELRQSSRFFNKR
jgi:cytochrome c oxidase accessory protein FixG